jgi:hypothetical protein
MLQTYEAVLEPNGHLRFLEGLPETLPESRRVLVTFTKAPDIAESDVCGLRLSEPVLAQGWLNEAEEAAWAHLQPGKWVVLNVVVLTCGKI